MTTRAERRQARCAKIRDTRAVILDRSQPLMQAAIEAAKADPPDAATMPREWRALYNRDEVVRMSVAGTPVAEIAAALDLSYQHVVALRARLGVGRRR